MLMFFRPSFCANCGEKIARTDWGVFTSRRFCPVCESEYKGVDLIPRAVVAFGVIFGMWGMSVWLQSPSDRNRAVESSPVAIRERPTEQAVANLERERRRTVTPPLSGDGNSVLPHTLVSERTAYEPPIVKRPNTIKKAEEPIYYCGAETKKGTACTRRVKGNVRCYQHLGMPVMATAEGENR